jgi:hypothetical protein
LRGIDSKALEGAQEISFGIEDRTQKLNIIADWQEDIRRLIADEMNSLDTAGLAWLRAEVDRFNLACKGVRA